MQLANAFLPATLVALLSVFGSSPQGVPASTAANTAFAIAPTESTWTEAGAGAANGSGTRASDPGKVVRNSPADRLFYVTATVNGKPLRFVVDTGSSMVVLTEADARQAGVARLDDAPLHVATANGASAMHPANLESVELAGQTIHNVDGAIVDANLKVSLLGQSALSRLRSVRLVGDKLELN